MSLKLKIEDHFLKFLKVWNRRNRMATGAVEDTMIIYENEGMVNEDDDEENDEEDEENEEINQ